MNNKIIAIGDTHGRDIWKQIVEKEKNADRIVFIGDYFDTFNPELRGKVEMENFKEIVSFARLNPEKVVLLIGNHDFHYMHCAQEQYSGHNMVYADIFGTLLADASDIMQMCHIEERYLFSHAGVTNTWLSAVGTTVEEINELFRLQPNLFSFNRQDKSGYGNSPYQSPIWVRPESLIPDALQDYIQVVGHTHQSNILYYEGVYPTRLILTDCLDNVNEYLTIINGEPSTSKL